MTNLPYGRAAGEGPGERRREPLNESKISQRQLTRMIYIEGVGASGLTFPAAAALCSRSEGLLPLVAYAGFLLLFAVWLLFLIRRLERRNPAGMSAGYGFVLSKWMGVLYMLRLFVNALALFYFFGLSIQKIYMPDTGLFMILLPFALLLWYCTQTTLQKRARFLELLFPWIMALFVILVFFAILGLEGKFHLPELTDNVATVFGNGYLLLLCSTPLEFLLFLVPAVTGNLWKTSSPRSPQEETQEKIQKQFQGKQQGSPAAGGSAGADVHVGTDVPEDGDPEQKVSGAKDVADSADAADAWWKKRRALVWRAVAGVLVWNVLLWFVTIENLGGEITASSPWPVIKVMQLIRLPGGFLERFDILLAVFWILCLVGVLSGYLYYGRKIGEEIFGGKIFDGRTLRFRVSVITAGVAALLLLISCLLAGQEETLLLHWFVLYKKWVDFPLLVLLPLRALFRKPCRRLPRRAVAATAVLVVMFALSGCGRQADVEEKSYVLSLYVEDGGENYEYWVSTADLPSMKAQEDSIPCITIHFTAENMEVMEEKFAKTQAGILEWNHIDTIFLGPKLAENPERLDTFLKEWEASWQKSPNVLLSVCLQTPEELLDIKNIPEGAAGQEVSRLMEQTEQEGRHIFGWNDSAEGGIYCRTPIEVLKAKSEGEKDIYLYQTKIQWKRLVLKRGYRLPE